MPSRRTVRTLVVLLAAAGLLVAGTAWALGPSRIPGPDGVYRACYNDGGNVKLISPGDGCAKGWTGPVTWNAQGPPGVAGQPGPQGERGPQGPQGVPGTDGRTMASLDELAGLRCQVDTAVEGTVDLTYAADGTVTLTCAARGWMSLVGVNTRAQSGEVVTTRGVVTGVTADGRSLWVQDPAGGPWSGMLVSPSPPPGGTVVPGDLVEITGVYTSVTSSAGVTRDSLNYAAVEVLDTGAAPAPTVVDGDPLEVQDRYAGVLGVRHGPWVVESKVAPMVWRLTGGGDLFVGSMNDAGLDLPLGATVEAVTGHVRSGGGNLDDPRLVLEPRSAADVAFAD